MLEKCLLWYLSRPVEDGHQRTFPLSNLDITDQKNCF
jgi:hypothetical protein